MVARPDRQAVQAALLIGLLACPVSAQEPVNKAADYVSYVTAAVNPAVAVIKAFRSDDKLCHLGQLAISEGIGNGSTLALKHFIVSPRPCAGCPPTGMPSGHSMNAMIGSSWNWKFSLSFSVVTGELRGLANRHTWQQVGAGWTIGGLSELAGQKLLRCRE